MIDRLAFRVDGVPATKGSWRVVMLGHGRKRKPALIPDNPGEPLWAQLVAWHARAALRNTLEPDGRRYRVRAAFTLPRPTGRKNRRDLDKLVRSILDALTGIVWIDDEQVDEVLTSKEIGPRPGLDVVIEVI